MRTLSPSINYIALIVVLLSIAFWIGAFFFGYLGDVWTSPPANERSFPASKGY